MGDGFSIAWRVLDAQFWGVPQRRRRIALVADFGGQSAPEILFEHKGVPGYHPPGATPWEVFAAAIAKRFGTADRARGRNECVVACGLNCGDVSHTLISGMAKQSGTTQDNNIICIQGNAIDRADTAGCNGRGWREDKCYTLNTVDRPAVFDARGNGDGKTSPTITGDHNNRVTDYTALCVRERCGCDGGGKGVLVQKNKSATLGTSNDQFVLAIDRAAFNQGQNEKYDFEVTDSGINSTLTAKDPPALCVVECAGFKSLNGAKARSIAYEQDLSPTLAANKIDASVVNKSTVRRLTPLECERLQGFPDGWTQIGDLIGFEECEDESGEKWKYGIYEYIDSKGKKRKTSDSARYKALGNSIALPPWAWILERLSRYCGIERTMASLFDGIGGFPLIWEIINGQGSCIWASEIEEFPVAVTKYHFKESN